MTKLARTYSAFGPVLTEAVSEQLRKFAGAAGSKSGAITDRVRDTWQLGPGWVSHVSAELAAGLRDGSSTRGGSLGYDMDLSDLNSSWTTPCRQSVRRRASTWACLPPLAARVAPSTPLRSTS